MAYLKSDDERKTLERLFGGQQQVLTVVCSNNVLRDVAYETNFSEFELGTRLNLSHSDVANIDQRDTGYERKYQVFLTWKRRFGNGATYFALANALARCRPFDLHLLEFVKFKIEAENSTVEVEKMPAIQTEEMLSPRNELVPSHLPPLAYAGVPVLVTSIVLQLHMSALLLSKEEECQALQTRIKRYEEKISELQMSHAVLQEKLKKQDVQTKKIISQLQAENNHLRNGLEPRYQTQSTGLTQLHVPLGIPVQASTGFTTDSMADSIIPKIEADSLASNGINCSAGMTDCEIPSKKRVSSVSPDEAKDPSPQFLSVEESSTQPLAMEESLYCSNADQECSSIVLPTNQEEQELQSNEHSLVIGDAFLAMDESALIEWPSRQGRKRSLPPDTSPVQAKVLLA